MARGTWEAVAMLQKLRSVCRLDGSLHKLLDEIVRSAIAISGADFGNIQLIDPATSELKIMAHSGFPPWWVDFWNTVQRGKGVCGTALERGMRVIVEDVTESPIFMGTRELEMQLRAGVRAVQSTPLVSRTGKMLGVFSTHYKTPQRLDNRTLLLLDLLAREAADQVERVEAQEMLRESEERFRALAKASSDVIYRMSPNWDELRVLQGRDFIADTKTPMHHWLQKYIPKDEQPHVMAVIRQAIRSKDKFELEHRVLRVDGSLGWTFSRAVPIFDENGNIMEWFGMAKDVTERKEAEELTRQANRTLQTIRDCHEAMLRAEDETGLLNEICRIIVEIGGERMAWVGYVEQNPRKTVRPVAMAGHSKNYLATSNISWGDKPRGRGPVGTAIRTGKVAQCIDTLTDPNFAPWREAARRMNYRSTIALPLIVDGGCIGALSIYASRPDAFDAAERLLLTDLANDLAFGIATLRLRAERARLEDEILKSIEREQARIGRDLHDGLCQLLTGAKFRCGFLGEISNGELAEARKEARTLEGILNSAIKQARGLARGLNPVKVTPTGLGAALQKLAEESSNAKGPRLICTLNGAAKIPDHHTANHLYRIAQEAVQNAVKHARAKNINIGLERRGRSIVLLVADDGLGMSQRTKESGMGLSNMRMRASLIGGRLEISSCKRGGTLVACEFTPRNGAKNENINEERTRRR